MFLCFVTDFVFKQCCGTSSALHLALCLLRYVNCCFTRHKDKESEFVSLSEELQATNPICDHAWRIWEREIRPMDKANVRLPPISALPL